MAGYIGSKAVSVNTTSATISDDLSVGDDATITGDLAVDGVANLDNTDIDGTLDVSGQVTVADGSAGAPSISNTGDVNTGIFFPAADTIAFAEGGEEAARFDSSGRFLLGHTSAVPISTNNMALQTVGTGFTTSGALQSRFEASASGPSLLFAHSRGSVGAHAILEDGDEFGKIRFYGSDGNDFANYGAHIVAAVDGTPGNNDMPGRIVFGTTADGAASPTERMRIDALGVLSIKNTGSTANFVSETGTSLIVGNGTSGHAMTIYTGTGSNGSIYFADGNSGNATYRGGIQYLHGSDSMRFNTAANNAVMTLDSTGAVTMPAQPAFHVVKNADQNNIAVGSNVTVVWQVESYDVGANFASNTFTAPVAGKYIFTASIRIDSLDSTGSEHNDMAIVTSNRSYKNIFDLRGLSADPTYWTFTINAVADMDAGDTAYVQFYQDGGAAQSDIKNDSGRTYFSGYLLG